MPFHAPAPGSARRRRAEHGEEVALWIADQQLTWTSWYAGGPFCCLERSKDRLEVHDRRRGQVTPLAQPGSEQAMRELPLRLGSSRRSSARFEGTFRSG